MKRIILIFVICLLCIGCGKQEKNVTINIYENSDKSEVKEEINKTDDTTKENQEQTSNKKTNENQSNEKQNNDIKVEQQTTQSNNQASAQTNSESTLGKVKDKTINTYNNAKDWYNTNKDELKDINGEIVEEDKNTINDLIDKAKDWYNTNKGSIKEQA